MKCRDCMHLSVCEYDAQKYNIRLPDNPEKCSFFADKSQYIKLPCKVRDTVYFIKAMFSYMAMPKAEKIRKVEITEDGMTFRTENRAFNPKAINQTVFLTKEAADKALRGKKIMTEIKCSMDKCIHNIDGHCSCNFLFIDNYSECEMYDERTAERALREREK